MVNIYNTSLLKRATDLLNVRDGGFFHNAVSPIITPVLELNKPVNNVMVNQSTSTTGTATVYTTPSDKDFYLTYMCLEFQADATADNTSVGMNFTVNGTGVPFINLRKLTTTATTLCVPVTLNPPIKIDRGTNITYSTTFTVGACSRSATIAGYISDTLAN